MKPTLKSTLIALGIAAATLASAPAFADKWNMPVRSNERNYFTRNIMQFADEVKKTTGGELEIVIHPETSLIKQPDVKRGVQTAQAQIGEFLMSMHSNESALFGVDSVPFLATTSEEGAKLLKVMRPLLERVAGRAIGNAPKYARSVKDVCLAQPGMVLRRLMRATANATAAVGTPTSTLSTMRL